LRLRHCAEIGLGFWPQRSKSLGGWAKDVKTIENVVYLGERARAKSFERPRKVIAHLTLVSVPAPKV